MTRYVCGFLFNTRLDEVALIEKNKPEWQRGKLNGIGGKIEPGESAHEAMVREFSEETATLVPDWVLIGEISGKDYSVAFFTARADVGLDSPTDERVTWINIPGGRVPEVVPVVANLRWMIPLARLYWGVEEINTFRIIDHSAFSATD